MHLVSNILTRSSRHTFRFKTNMITNYLNIRLTILRHTTSNLHRTNRFDTIRRTRNSITIFRMLTFTTILFLYYTENLLTMVQLCHNQLSVTRSSGVRRRRRKGRRYSHRGNTNSNRRRLLATTGMLFTHNTLIIDLDRMQILLRGSISFGLAIAQ